MKKLKRIVPILVLWLGISQSAAVFAQPVLEGDFYKFTSDRFFVFLWKDVPPEKLNAPQGADPLVAKLEEIAHALEGYLNGVLAVLELGYAVEQWGRIAIYVYASSEEYQQRTGCFLCAAHVTSVPNTPENMALVRDKKLNPYAVYAHLDNTPVGPGGLTIGLPQNVLPHELTHVIDLSFIGGAKPSTLREGLAVYVAYKSDGFDDGRQFALTAQHLQQFILEYDPGFIANQLSGCGGLRRFTYNFGVSFINFLVERASIKRFLEFYAALKPQPMRDGPPGCTFGYPREVLDPLFQRFFGLSYGDAEQAYLMDVLASPLTEEGRDSYAFTMDQIYNRFLQLKPLLKDETLVETLARGVWSEGGFDQEKARALREYLSRPENYLATPEAIQRASGHSVARLRSFVNTYRDATVQAELQVQLAQLSLLLAGGQLEAWRDLFVLLVNRFVTWRF